MGRDTGESRTHGEPKPYEAGADYVLAVATVAGRLLASSLLSEDVISFDQSVELVRLDCGPFAGRTLAGADIRARTGVTVVAVERDGEVITDLGPDFRIQADDDLVVVGTDEDVNRLAATIEG